METIGTVLLGAVGALALWGLYRALEFNWPDQYVSLNDTFALRLNHTWWRLPLYRFVPVFGAGVAVWATTSRLGLEPTVAVVTMTLLHVLQTNARAALQSFGLLLSKPEFQVNYASYHLATIGVVLVAGAGSIFFAPSLEFLVPRPSTLLESLWVAIFIAIAGGVAVAIIGKRPSGARPFDPNYYVWRAERDVGLELIDVAFEKSLEYRCDPVLLRAIMYAEAIQRPKWVRRLERAKGRLVPRGSYGVTQERAERPISDAEAIRRTASKIAGRWGVVQGESGLVQNPGLIWMHAVTHNEDVAFIGGVQEIYSSIFHGVDTVAYHNSMIDVIHVIEIRRYPQNFGFRALTAAAKVKFKPVAAVGEKDTIVLRRPDDVERGELWAFELELDVDVSELRIKVKGRDPVNLFLNDAVALG